MDFPHLLPLSHSTASEVQRPQVGVKDAVISKWCSVGKVCRWFTSALSRVSLHSGLLVPVCTGIMTRGLKAEKPPHFRHTNAILLLVKDGNPSVGLCSGTASGAAGCLADPRLAYMLRESCCEMEAGKGFLKRSFSTQMLGAHPVWSPAVLASPYLCGQMSLVP